LRTSELWKRTLLKDAQLIYEAETTDSKTGGSVSMLDGDKQYTLLVKFSTFNAIF
jgi:hypothetical protein